MPEDIKLPESDWHAVFHGAALYGVYYSPAEAQAVVDVVPLASGPVAMYTADQVRAAVLADREERQQWQPIETAPAGLRILLGPREAPVAGMVKHYEDGTCANVVHYNGSVLVADYHCTEWSPLPAGAQRQVAGAVREPVNGDGWKVVWWNESMRLLLPDGYRLDHWNGYRNGTKQLTIKADAQRAKGDA
ncbi:Uncharacterised protein [Bordetella ansorpii]|uniref:Uncharacterized protein n=1 Tax=Bordetella ansorpii TaxID=288768 RepID=A0A157RMJ0_9BORD|nr:hypothetical protein [Bordetella ansorpii]SAI59104.1 Uncharacterised protein [Bordetella ansorpii]